MITVQTHPLQTSLVDLAQLRREVDLPDAATPMLQEQARHVSGAVEVFCGRPFSRAVILETVRGYGGTTLTLSRTPVVVVSSLLESGSVVLDFTVDDPDAGFLFRERGWEWTAGTGWYLESSRIAHSESPVFAVTYTGGYLLPDDDVASALLAVDATLPGFTRPSGVFPLLVAGDRIRSSDFVTAANNGDWTVVSRTATQIVVAEAGLVTEAASDSVKGLRVRTLPGSVERAALDAVKALFIGRARDPVVASRSITGLSISYQSGGAAGPYALPPSSTALLTPFRRAA